MRLIVSLTGFTGDGRTDASNDAFGSPMADMFTNGLPGLCFAHIGRSVGPPSDLLSLDIDLDFCNENLYIIINDQQFVKFTLEYDAVYARIITRDKRLHGD